MVVNFGAVIATPCENDWEAARRFIHIRRHDGAIVYESVLRREWPGDFDGLIACVGDNIIDAHGSGEEDEIDWLNVEKDYATMIASRECSLR